MRTILVCTIFALIPAFQASAQDKPHGQAAVEPMETQVLHCLDAHPEIVANIAAALPEKLSAVSKQKRKILVITGPDKHHIEGKAGLLALLRAAAEKYGVFEISERFEVPALDAKALRAYDAVVLNSAAFLEDKTYKDFNLALLAYVQDGGGVFANHATGHNNGILPRLLGFKMYRFVGGPPFPVKVMAPDSPLMAAFLVGQGPKEAGGLPGPRVIADELNVGILEAPDEANPTRALLAWDTESLSSDRPAEKKMYPQGTLVWSRRYGQGRVYFNEFAHKPTVFAMPVISRSLLDGLQYVLGDLAVDDSPPKSANTTARTELKH